VLLSLVTGSMRAITGLIGKASPERVAYKAGNATMGIRGTDIKFATDAGNVVMTVTTGKVSFTFNGNTTVVVSGQALLTKDGKLTEGMIARINRMVKGNEKLANALNSVSRPAVSAALDAAGDKWQEAEFARKKAADLADAAKYRSEIDKQAAAAALLAAEKAAADAKAALELAKAARAALDDRDAAAANANAATANAYYAAYDKWVRDSKSNLPPPAPPPSPGAGTSGGGGPFKVPASGS